MEIHVTAIFGAPVGRWTQTHSGVPADWAMKLNIANDDLLGCQYSQKLKDASETEEKA
jgi:hypothetical protein